MHNSNPTVAVIGAGIVGVSAALHLQRKGANVVLFDRAGPGNGASFGNAGMISPDSVMPASVPGMLQKIPGWLRDPLGPLAIRPSYLPKALPYMLRWAWAGRLEQVLRGSDALKSLHGCAFAQYEDLLGDKRFAEFVRQTGQIFYWEGKPTANTVRDLVWQRHGVVHEDIDLRELPRLVPALQKNVSHAIIRPNTGHTTNPHRLVCAIAENFEAIGGKVERQEVLEIGRLGQGFSIRTNLGTRKFDRVVVAAGAWSIRLLKPLGYSFPLETERGYHLEIPEPNVPPPPVPVTCQDKPVAASPIDGGIRCAGTIEFAGLDAPMNPARATVMLQRMKAMLPELAIEKLEYRTWMGHRPSLPDSLPVIDHARNDRGLIFAFGHGQAGMTGGPLTGRLASELALDQAPTIDLAPFRSTRFGLLGA